MKPPTSVLSTILKTRASLRPLRNAVPSTALKIDVNRRCVMAETIASGEPGFLVKETPQEEFLAMQHRSPDLKDAIQNVLDDSTSSVVLSWPDDGSFATFHHTANVLRTFGQALQESHPDVTTTKPFFMLDGGGLRMASLSVIGNHQDRLFVDNCNNRECSVEYHDTTPGAWLRRYCSLRASANS
jgi:hypothetical protein